MGRYLDALKKVEIVGGDYPNKPKELEKGGILGLLGTPPPRFEINNAVNDGDQDTDNNRHYRWLIHFPERDPVHTCCLPEPTHAEVLAMYPDAIAAEPMPERTRHQATPEQEAELRALVAAVGVAYAFTHEEQQEALALALSDPDAALQSYRAMAAELGNNLEHDDRRHCDQCANLRRDVCTIAEPKAGALEVSAKPAPIKACTLDTPDTPEIINAVVNIVASVNVATETDGKPKTLQDRQREARRQKVIAMLEAAPGTLRAIYTDTDSDPHNVILTVAVRACQQTCEMLIPKAKYDPWKLLELIERHGQTTH